MAVQHSTGRRTLCPRVTLPPTFISKLRTAVERNLNKWHSESEGQAGSILVRGTANWVLAPLQSDVRWTCCITIGLLKIESQGNLSCFRIPLVRWMQATLGKQIRKLIQDCVFTRCGEIWYLVLERRRADRVPNRKVSTQKEETSVLGPQRARKRGSSPEQESTNSEPDNSFSAWSSKRVKRE